MFALANGSDYRFQMRVCEVHTRQIKVLKLTGFDQSTQISDEEFICLFILRLDLQGVKRYVKVSEIFGF